MSRYRKVEVRMWGDAKFRTLNDEEKLLWCYLLTGHETTTIPGVIVAGEAGLAEALNWSLEQFRNRFQTISERLNVQFDRHARLVFLPSAARHNPPANPNVVKSWARGFLELPESSLQPLIVDKIANILNDLDNEAVPQTAYRDLFLKQLPKGLGKGYLNRFETVSKQSRIQKQKQKQNKETDMSRSETNVTDGESATIQIAVTAVLGWYARHHARAKPGVREKALVRGRLAEGFTVEDLNMAIDVIHAHPFYCGQNDRHTRYQKLIHALRNSDTVTSHLEWADKNKASLAAPVSVWAMRGAPYGLRPQEADEIALKANYEADKFDEIVRGMFNG